VTRVRAFFAMPLPSDLLAAVKSLQSALAPLAPELRWMEEEKLHLTLKFLGHVDEGAVPELARGLGRLLEGSKPIPAQVTALDAFPAPRRARVLVLTLRDEGARLSALAEGLDDLAERHGVPRESRPFKAHVTLARAKAPEDLRALLAAVVFPRLDAVFDRARLYQSELLRSGSRYTALAECALGT
jgi:RNA 2',3'-cyclic 3'-phosphodiesterase